MMDKTESIGLKKKREYTAPAMELMIIENTEVMTDSEHDNSYGDFGDFFGWSLRNQNDSKDPLDDYYRE